MHSPQLLVFKDRAFKTDELELIHEVVDSCPRLSRQELANTVCELLGLAARQRDCRLCVRPNLGGCPGACRTRLPEKRGKCYEAVSGRWLRCSCPCVETSPRERRLWRELVDRYRTIWVTRWRSGRSLQYLVQAATPAASGWPVCSFPLRPGGWPLATDWIGWEEATRRSNLQKIVNQSRFLRVIR